MIHNDEIGGSVRAKRSRKMKEELKVNLFTPIAIFEYGDDSTSYVQMNQMAALVKNKDSSAE